MTIIASAIRTHSVERISIQFFNPTSGSNSLNFCFKQFVLSH